MTIATTQIRKYLLGQLSGDALAALESQLLTGHEAYELLQAEEDELIDEYLAGTLTAMERRQFEEIFLAAPVRREQLRVARAFHQQLNRSAQTLAAKKTNSHVPWWRLSPLPLAAMLVLVAALGWGLWRAGYNNQVPSFTLLPIALLASEPTNTINVPPNVSQVRLNLNLNELEPGLYQAVLRNSAGREQNRWEGLRPQAQGNLQEIVLEVPAKLLAAGAYKIYLTATDAAGKAVEAERYAFQVNR